MVGAYTSTTTSSTKTSDPSAVSYAQGTQGDYFQASTGADQNTPTTSGDQKTATSATTAPAPAPAAPGGASSPVNADGSISSTYTAQTAPATTSTTTPTTTTAVTQPSPTEQKALDTALSQPTGTEPVVNELGTQETAAGQGTASAGAGATTAPTGYTAIDPTQTGTLEQAQAYLNSWTQSTFGGTLTPEQWQQLGGMIGYTGGPVTGEMVNRAAEIIQQYAPQLGWQPQAQTPTQPQPQPEQPQWGPNNIDPNVAQQTVKDYFAQTLGRQITEPEWQQLLTQMGDLWQPGQPITQAIVDMAKERINQYKKQQQAEDITNNPQLEPGPRQNVTFNLEPFASQFSRYQAQQITPFQAPNYSGYENNQLQALQNALNNSEWSPQRLAAMKEVQKEQALAMQKQAQESIDERFAAQGRTNGGAYDAQNNRLDQATISDILASYRDVDERGANARRDELLRTSDALRMAMDSGASRANSFYQSLLQGQELQGKENSKAWESQFAPYELALKKALGEQGASLDWSKLNEDARQYGLGLHEDQRQFNLKTMVDLIKFMEEQRQFNEGMGLDWTKFNWSQLGL